jgi:protein involved in polysaccharide export with SLBB domain
MSSLRILVASSLVAVLAACASTDVRPPVVPGPAAPTAAAKRVDPEVERWFRSTTAASGIRLLAGDRLSVTVQSHPELTIARDVPPNGAIPVLRQDKSVATVNALGKTPQELESDIAEVHRADFEHPYVTVTLDAAAKRSISVVGAVKNQNVYPVSGNDRLTVLQALALAGGATDRAQLTDVTIQRVYPPTGMSVASPPLDLRRVMENRDQSDNLIVQPGDTIVVPGQEESTVSVLGRVNKQGAVAWTKGMRLSQAIAMAGGFDKFPRLDRIKLVHHGDEQVLVDFNAVLDRSIPDPELEPQDVIYVDERFF